ncbi:PREDICTED: transmembrane protein 181-like [Acropora digitifera]|uniref:transmembrane protein 181-like n=1 Tax=Acropora digitifera TaxID=70779 RepID=UPI00077B1111|nr:PREDICTED: transmembrane protein 181-like [Acropora digitifera]
MGTKEMDSTVQMRLYTLTKRQFVLVFVAFFVSFFLTAIIGIAGPPIIVEHLQKASYLVPKEKFTTGPFNIDTGILSTFNQQLWLLCQIKLNGTNSGTSFTREFHLNVQILARSKDSSYHVIAMTPYNRTRTLRCKKECSPLVILHLGYIDYPSYVAVINFHSLNLPKGIKVSDIDFSLKHYNADFTQVEIWFRFVFLVLSFMVTCMFAHSLRRFSLREWSIEQKYVGVTVYMYKYQGCEPEFLAKTPVKQIKRRKFSQLSRNRYSFLLHFSVIITGLRFGTGVLQDNFVAELETHYENSAEFLTFYGLLNFYLYTMAFVYSPSKNALYESYFRDQSTFSMLNESEDEESIYNSQPEKAHFASSDEEE